MSRFPSTIEIPVWRWLKQFLKIFCLGMLVGLILGFAAQPTQWHIHLWNFLATNTIVPLTFVGLVSFYILVKIVRHKPKQTEVKQ